MELRLKLDCFMRRKLWNRFPISNVCNPKKSYSYRNWLYFKFKFPTIYRNVKILWIYFSDFVTLECIRNIQLSNNLCVLKENCYSFFRLVNLLESLIANVNNSWTLCEVLEIIWISKCFFFEKRRSSFPSHLMSTLKLLNWRWDRCVFESKATTCQFYWNTILHFNAFRI